jgi:hypothetical protein
LYFFIFDVPYLSALVLLMIFPLAAAPADAALAAWADAACRLMRPPPLADPGRLLTPPDAWTAARCRLMPAAAGGSAVC